MTERLSIALAQISPAVGDVLGNLKKIRAARAEAAAQGADLVVLPELCVTGYPPEDLILKPDFLRVAFAAVDELAADTADGGPGLLIGAPWVEPDLRRDERCLQPLQDIVQRRRRTGL